MACQKKNPIETEVQQGRYEGTRVLVLRWRESDFDGWRRIQAETFRIAATVCDASGNERWVVDADVGCGCIGRGLLATLVTIEMAEGDAAETARAEALLRKVAQGLKN